MIIISFYVISRLEIYSGFKCTLWVAVDLLNIEEFFQKNCFSKDTDFYLSFLQFHDVL